MTYIKKAKIPSSLKHCREKQTFGLTRASWCTCSCWNTQTYSHRYIVPVCCLWRQRGAIHFLFTAQCQVRLPFPWHHSKPMKLQIIECVSRCGSQPLTFKRLARSSKLMLMFRDWYAFCLSVCEYFKHILLIFMFHIRIRSMS